MQSLVWRGRYLSGEDPYLGAQLVGPIINGIQAQGVIANAKHYVNNNQETAREGIDTRVDERTQWEMYYPPFQAAVDAGLLSVMCSYVKNSDTFSICALSVSLTPTVSLFQGTFAWHGAEQRRTVSAQQRDSLQL